MRDNAKKIAVVVGLIGAFALGVALGKDVGRSNAILQDLEREKATQAYADCILLRGKQSCPMPSELSR